MYDSLVFYIYFFWSLTTWSDIKKQALPNPTPVNKKLKLFKHYLILKWVNLFLSTKTSLSLTKNILKHKDMRIIFNKKLINLHDHKQVDGKHVFENSSVP